MSVASFRKGKIARITVQETIQQDVHLNVSLARFSAGYKALLKAAR